MKAITLYLEDETYQRVVELAKDEKRSVSNFIQQHLATSLDDTVDRQALRARMNPALYAGIKAATRNHD